MSNVFCFFARPPALSDKVTELTFVDRTAKALIFPEVTVDLPAHKLDVRAAIVESSLAAWVAAVDVVANIVGPNDICILPFDDPLRQFFQLGARLGKWKYGVYFDAAPRVYGRDYEFLGAA